MTEPRPKIYLAGPDVFHAEARDIGRRKKAICAALGAEGLFPLDNEIDLGADAPARIAAQIYAANIAMLDQADGVVGNVTPFLGALADDGAAFEIGYAVARRLPIALYDNGAGDTASKVAALLGAAPSLRDPAITAEDFGLPVNLMLAIAADDACGLVSGAEAIPMTDLARFEAAARRLVERLGGGGD